MTVIKGVGACPGKACGPVAKLVSEGIPTHIVAGSILVARVVHPYLAPLFPMLGGVVVEDGGVLQHAVILAREFRLPAIVGVREALTRLIETDKVCIDGATGEIDILPNQGLGPQK